MDVGIVAMLILLDIDLANQTWIVKNLQGIVDRIEADGWKSLLQIGVDHLHTRMVLRARSALVNNQPLGGVARYPP